MNLVGQWRMVTMDLWDREAIDYRDMERGGRPGVESTWDGRDEGDPANGRGWAVMETDGSLQGHIYFHLGDDSGFRAALRDEEP